MCELSLSRRQPIDDDKDEALGAAGVMYETFPATSVLLNVRPLSRICGIIRTAPPSFVLQVTAFFVDVDVDTVSTRTTRVLTALSSAVPSVVLPV